MTDLDAALAATSPATETARTVVSSDRPCRRHQWYRVGGPPDEPWDDNVYYRCRCGAIRDDTRSRRGRSSRRLGGDQERRIERVYGPRKVGEYGDAIDLLGRDFAWQSKATRDPMPEWLRVIDEPVSHMPTSLVALSAAAMLPILGSRHPLVIQSWVRNGLPTRDRIWVRGEDWRALHGGAWNAWLVMSGEHFLAVHGRDEPT